MSKITVKDVLLLCAKMLNLTDAVSDLTSGAGAQNVDVQELLRCFNVVENEIALDYLPLHAEQEVNTKTGEIKYTALHKNVVGVLRVRDESGKSIPFKLFPDQLKTQSGKIVITYTYAPEEKTLTDECECRIQVSKRLLAYGIAAEYAFAQGMFEEAAVWDKKYKDAIEAANCKKPSHILRSRRWA